MRRRRLVRTAVRTTGAALLMAASLAATTAPSGAQPTDDQQDSTGVEIAVESVSPWVAPDGDWRALLTVTGAPADAKLSYSIRQPPAGTEASIRQTLIDSLDGTDEPKVMRSPVSKDLAALTDTSGSTRLDIPIRSGRSGDRERILIPNSGVYPVVVSVMAADGTSLAHTSLYLNRLPSEAPDGGPYRLGVLVQPDGAGGFDNHGDLDITPGLRSSIDAAVDTLAAGDGLPLQLVVSPEAMVALTQSEVPGDLELVERLVRELGDASVLRVPWARLHTEGWATTGTLSDVQTSLIDGQQALFARLPRQIEARLWPPDETVGPNSVDLLTKLGISAMVVEPDRFTGAKAPTGESGFSRPFRVAGSSDASIAGLSLDPQLQALVEGSSDGPGLAVHQIVTLMFGAWLADDAARGSVLRLDDSADPAIVTELLRELREVASDSDSDRAIEVVDPADVATLPPVVSRQSGREVAWTRELMGTQQTPTVTGISDRLDVARPLVDDYAAIVPSGDPVAARQAIVVQRSLDRSVTPGEQEALLDTAIAEMSADLAKVSASESRSLTVTSRRASIPLRFTNDLGRPIRVRLRLQSPRLDFIEGDEQALTLQPGLNRIDVAVEVRASGQFPMQVDLLAPDSDRVLASTRQRIRSTTFSGVGLMLSGGALLFLVIWWSRTLRRREDDKDPDASTDPDPDPDDPATNVVAEPVAATEPALPVPEDPGSGGVPVTRS